MENIVIGIEGYVGAGKSALCNELLKFVPNSILLDGGNFYRAIVYSIMKSGINLEELKQTIKNVDIKSIMEKLKVSFNIENRVTCIYINGEKVDFEKLQSRSSSIAVSEVGGIADNKNLYIFARNIIENLKTKFNVIVSGRDLMQIYPGLDYHFMITASLEERIRRKCIQYGNNADLEIIKNEIIKRDELQKQAGYYNIYENTIEIDVTECKSPEESAKKVLEYIKF